MSINNIEGLQQFKAGKLHAVFAVDAQDSSLASTRVSLKTSLVSPKQNGFDFGEARLESRARLDLKNGDVDIESAKLEIPALLRLDLKGKAQKWGEKFSIEGKTSQLHVHAIPVKLASGMNMKITGNGSMNFSAQGNKAVDLKSMKLPIEAHIGLALNDILFADDQDRLKMEKGSYSANIDLKDNNMKVYGKLAFGKLLKKDLLGDVWLEPELNYQYILTDWNKLVLEKHDLTFKNIGVTHTLSGRVEGFRNFFTMDLPFSPVEIGKRLDIALASTSRLKISQALPMAKNLKASGAVASRLTFNLVPGKELVLDGELSFDRFDCAIEPFLNVKGITGRVPFNKKFVLDKKLVSPSQKEIFSVSEKGFFRQLRDFSAYKNTLSVDSAEYDAYKLTRIGMDLLYKDNRLAVEKFIMDLLKGSLGGQLFLSQTAQGPMLNFSTEFAGLDFNDLAGDKAVSGAKSQIDGNMQMGFKVNQGVGSEKAAIGQIEAKIAITRIGDEALDRILLFLDPDESKPAIVDTRAKLKLASPQRLLIGLENGNLSVEIWLVTLGGVVKAPELKRVPVASLKRFQLISDQLQALAGFRSILQYLSARGIEFNEEGGFSLF